MKSEVVARIRDIAEKDSVLEFADEFSDLQDEFYRLQSEEEHQWEVEKLERIEGGEKPESIEKPVFEYLEEVKALSRVFNEKKKVEVQAIKDAQKKNLEKKKTYIAALKDLIQNEENIGRAIARYRDIQIGWKEVGDIPRDKRQEIQKEYSNLVDSFQYNINIYKEIKDHDLSRNLKLKKDVIEKLQELLKVKRIKEVEKRFHELQNEWDTIGGTHQEEWEKVKTEYWDTVNAIYDKIRTFYQDRREQRAKNIEDKKEIISKMKEMNENFPSSHKGWKNSTDKVLQWQKDWRSIGFGSKEENDVVWEEFRSLCDDFFDRKQQFYGKLNEKHNEIKEKKEKLIEEVADVGSSTDWKGTTKKVVDIQKKWKDLGSAGPKYENRLWKKFRKPIDDFFAAKDKHFGDLKSDYADNLKKKEKLIESLKKLKPKKDKKKSIEELENLSKEFAAIGKVPFKKKDSVQKDFNDTLNAKFKEFEIKDEDRDEMKFNMRLESISAAENKDGMIEKEKNFIRKNIDKHKKELAQYETNLAFFSNADESNPLFKNVMENIDGVKDKIEELKDRLRLLSDVKKAEKTQEQEATTTDEEE